MQGIQFTMIDLIILLVIALVGVFFMIKQRSKQAGKSDVPQIKINDSAPALPQASAQAELTSSPETENTALIAAITAAISMMLEAQTGFTVKRVKRISNAPTWQKTGREEQIYSRL